MRDRKATGMQTELRRLQTAIPSEKRGLHAQFEMAVTIQAAPKSWQSRLALAMVLSTVLKGVNIGLTYLADALFIFARQKCEDAGRTLTDEEEEKLDATIWEFYRKQQSDGEKQLAKSGGGASSNFRNRLATNPELTQPRFTGFPGFVNAAATEHRGRGRAQ